MPLNAKDVDRLMDNATIALPGSLLGALQLELFNVLDEFLQGTNIWQEWIPMQVDPSKNPVGSTYDIAASGGQIFRLMMTLDANHWQRQCDMAEPGVIRFRETANQLETWNAVVAKTVANPVSTRSNIPDAPEWILKQYRDGILAGLIGHMMAQPAKPYTNAGLAQFQLRKFKQCIGIAKAEAEHKNRFGANTWRFPQAYRITRLRRGA